MRHLLHKRKLGFGKHRSKGGRASFLKNLAASLILEEKIETTLAKAKTINSYVDSIASRAKKSNEKNNIRYIMKKLPPGKLGEIASRKLFSIVSNSDRSTGFLRVVKTNNRLGDSAQMASVFWVDPIEKELVSTEEDKEKGAKEDDK